MYELQIDSASLIMQRVVLSRARLQGEGEEDEDEDEDVPLTDIQLLPRKLLFVITFLNCDETSKISRTLQLIRCKVTGAIAHVAHSWFNCNA